MSTELITEEAQNLISETVKEDKHGRKNIKGRITFSTNALKTSGVLFNHAHPLDLSIIKYCFQGCPFCFATANKRANKDVIGKNEDPTDAFIKKLQKANGQGYNPEDLQEYCLRKKYPIMFSNNVDPFLPASEEQFKLGERVLEACLEYEQPLFIQTKEVYYGERVKQLLIEGQHLFHLYVSISTTEYDIAKKYETVAITPDERWKKIKELTDQGCVVTVALNPYVPEWQPDLVKYFDKVKDCGAVGVYAYPLHLSRKQKEVMPGRFEEFTQKANRYDDFFNDAKTIMEPLCKERDLLLHYPRRLPDDFYNGNAMHELEEIWNIDCHWYMEGIHEMWLEEQNPLLMTWESVDAFFSEEPYRETWEHVFNMNGFAGVLWYDNETYFKVRQALGKKNKMKNIVRFMWNNPDVIDSWMMYFFDNFQLIDKTDCEKGEHETVTDDNGDMLYVYDPTWKEDPWFWDQSSPAAEGIEFVEISAE